MHVAKNELKDDLHVVVLNDMVKSGIITHNSEQVEEEMVSVNFG